MDLTVAHACDRETHLTWALGMANALAFLIFALSMASVVCAQEAPRRVLILHAYNYTFPATKIGRAHV